MNNARITYIKKLCTAYLNLGDDPVSNTQKEEIIRILIREAATL